MEKLTQAQQKMYNDMKTETLHDDMDKYHRSTRSALIKKGYIKQVDNPNYTNDMPLNDSKMFIKLV